MVVEGCAFWSAYYFWDGDSDTPSHCDEVGADLIGGSANGECQVYVVSMAG